MESKITKLRFREDTSANWKQANPILASSEPAREIDTGKIKYGDGTTNYNDLPYFTTESLNEAPADDKIYGRKNKDWVDINYQIPGADKGIIFTNKENIIKYELDEEVINAINTSEINPISVSNIAQLKKILLNDFTRILSIYMTVKKSIWCNNHILNLKVQEDKTVQVSEVDGGSSNVMQENDKISLGYANSDNNLYRLSGVDKYGDNFNLKFNENGDGLILKLYPQSIYETQENGLNIYTTRYYIDKELTDEDVSFYVLLQQDKEKLNFYNKNI